MTCAQIQSKISYCSLPTCLGETCLHQTVASSDRTGNMNCASENESDACTEAPLIRGDHLPRRKNNLKL